LLPGGDGLRDLGAALVLRGPDRGDGSRGDDRVRGVPDLPVLAHRIRTQAGPRSNCARRPGGCARHAARMGDARRARRDAVREHLLPDHVLLLLLRLRHAAACAPDRLRVPAGAAGRAPQATSAGGGGTIAGQMRELVVDGRRIPGDGDARGNAEARQNHEGSLVKAIDMLRAAKEAGVDAVKLQKRDNRTLYTRAMYDQPYDHENSFGRTYGEHREALELSDKDWF